MGELLDGLHLAGLYHFLVLLLQFSHSGGTGTRGTLIAADVDALDVAELLQGLQHNHHHDGGAVGIGDDATGTLQGIGGIALGNHQGYIIIHTEGTAVVNHHAAVLGDGLGKLLRRAGTGRGKGDVDVLEVIVVLKQLHRQFLATERVLSTGRTL